MATALLTPYATLSFPHLFAPRPRAQGGEPVFSCALIFDVSAQKTPEFKAMQSAVIELARSKWGANVKLDSFVSPFKDAGEKADQYQGYEDGFIVINPWTKQKPGIVDSRLQDVLLPEQVYAGQIVRAQIAPFNYDNPRRGINFALNHVQIVKHDAPRIDGRIAANKAFGVVEDADDESPF